MRTPASRLMLGILCCAHTMQSTSGWSMNRRQKPKDVAQTSSSSTSTRTLGALPSMDHLFNPQTFQLANGLQVLVIPNASAASVVVGVIYRYGAGDDDPHVIGLAHFLEHMMFKGTKNMPLGAFDRKILRCGGRTNAWTHYDQTVYHTEVPSDFLSMMLELEADRMQNLSFDEGAVKSERDVVMQERLMRLENHPFGQAYEAFLRTSFWYHPYGTPVIGYPHHIRAYTYENTRAAYTKWYAPNNATLVISGNIGAHNTHELVQKIFGDIPAKPLPERTRAAEPDHQGIVSRMHQHNPRNSLTIVEWLYAAPNHQSVGKEHYYPLQVLVELIAGNPTRELVRVLVEEKKIALDLGCHYDGNLLDPHGIEMQVTLAPQATLEAVQAIIQEHLNRWLKQGFLEEQVRKAKRDLLARAIFAKDGIMHPLQVFSDVAHGLSVDEIDAWPQRISAVTKEQVDAAFCHVFAKQPISEMVQFPHLPQSSTQAKQPAAQQSS
jgi:zinc protease